MTAQKKIDEALLTAMWNRGASHHAIGAAVGISRPQVPRRAAKLGLPERTKPEPNPEPKPRVRIRKRVIRLDRAKPTPDAKPVAEPAYQPGLSDAIKRAKGSVQRLGKVATSYRVSYREVLAMAGVTV